MPEMDHARDVDEQLQRRPAHLGPVAEGHRDGGRIRRAGMVVTEMKTPTRAEDLPAVTDSTPAAPASSATMKDHLSGLTMNWTSSWPMSRESWSIQPRPLETSAHAKVIAIPTANPIARILSAPADQTEAAGQQAEAGGRDRAELGPEDHRAHDDHQGVGDDADAGELGWRWR
ncbi:hypothetical protein GCM10020219_038390 [Nonomuraea dietziae]